MPNASNANKKNQIQSLTGARFIAIMLIVVSHLEFLKNCGKYGEIYWKFFHNPTLGVDFFFLLSGFGLMLSNLRHDPENSESIGGIKNLIRFGIKHIKKIYPIYVLFLVVGIPSFIYFEIVHNGRTVCALLGKGIICFAADLTLIQSTSGFNEISHSFNGPCWFLSCLFCIYLISPLLIRFLRKKIKSMPAGLIWLSLSILFSFVSAIIFTEIEKHTLINDLCYGTPYRRVFYVICGMILALLYNFLKCTKTQPKFLILLNNGILEYLFMGISVIWFFLRNSTTEFLGPFVYIIDMIIVSGDLLALAFQKGKISLFLSSTKMIYLGNISMYIFLTHYNISSYISLFAGKLFSQSSLAIGLLCAVIIITLSIIFSVLIYKFTKKKRTASQ